MLEQRAALPSASSRYSMRLSSFASLSFAILNLAGLAAYFYPFLFAGATEPSSDWFAHNNDGPLLMAAVAGLCLLLVVSELGEGVLNSKSLAVLGVLAALAAVLRTITLPAGANLYFFLVILGGFVFGARLGFLLGVLSFFLSAVVTAGFGPWLPFQLFAAGWLGLTAGFLGGAAGGQSLRVQIGSLIVFGAAWGLLFGAITNLWSWPFYIGGPDISYQPGLGVVETTRRYWNYYLLTSLGWDLMRSVANVIVLVALGAPLLKSLERFHARFTWTREPR